MSCVQQVQISVAVPVGNATGLRDISTFYPFDRIPICWTMGKFVESSWRLDESIMIKWYCFQHFDVSQHVFDKDY